MSRCFGVRRGTIPHMGGHPFTSNLSNPGASDTRTYVYAETVSFASIPGSLELVAAIGEDNAPCTVGTTMYPSSSLTLPHSTTPQKRCQMNHFRLGFTFFQYSHRVFDGDGFAEFRSVPFFFSDVTHVGLMHLLFLS